MESGPVLVTRGNGGSSSIHGGVLQNDVAGPKIHERLEVPSNDTNDMINCTV